MVLCVALCGSFYLSGVISYTAIFTCMPLHSMIFQIVKRFDIIDATSYLLEKSGDIKGAFSLLLQVRLTSI